MQYLNDCGDEQQSGLTDERRSQLRLLARVEVSLLLCDLVTLVCKLSGPADGGEAFGLAIFSRLEFPEGQDALSQDVEDNCAAAVTSNHTPKARNYENH